MKLEDLIQKTCLLGISYFDTANQLIKQQQHAGTVVNVDNKNGISIELFAKTNSDSESTNSAKVFVIPPSLSAWFEAPKGVYRDTDGNTLITNPDYFATWDVYQTQDEKQGDHEWWEWVARTTPPTVGTTDQS